MLGFEVPAERGDVNRRMIIQRAVGRTKAEYFYFFCRGRQDGVCRSRHLPIDDVEDAVIDHYRTIRLAPDFVAAVKAGLDEIIRDQQRVQEALRRDLVNQLNQLEVKADNLVDLVAASGLASARAAARVREIEAEREIITERLKGVVDDVSMGVQSILGWLELLRDPHELYKNASNEMRRQLNQAIFTKSSWSTTTESNLNLRILLVRSSRHRQPGAQPCSPRKTKQRSMPKRRSLVSRKHQIFCQWLE